MDFATFLVQCLNAVQYGLLLFLVASGLTLIFGIMGVINLAHGSFYMLGAYLAFSLAPYFGQQFLLMLATGVLLSALFGFVLEWVFFSYLYQRDHLQQVLMTYALILVFEEMRSLLVGNDVHGVQAPQWLTGSFALGGLMSYPWYRVFASVACIVAFMALHTLGGRYAYSNVPYDDWARALTGATLSAAFGGTRNHYDRLVHFAFGALSVIPVAEIARRWGRLGPRGAALTVLGWVLAISSLYEIFEWLLTIVAAGETADRYNGQQGDIWDAQKDMALATLGAILVLPVQRRR